VPRPPTSRRFTLALPELDEIAERDATSQAPTFALVDNRELSSRTILFEVACICDDFPASHRHGTGPCMGWCDQTCQTYRPVSMSWALHSGPRRKEASSQRKPRLRWL
jgi:hypothetical protein